MRNNRFAFQTFLALIVSTPFTVVFAGPPLGTFIGGEIVSPSGQPIPGERVFLFASNQSAFDTQIKEDDDISEASGDHVGTFVLASEANCRIVTIFYSPWPNPKNSDPRGYLPMVVKVPQQLGGSGRKSRVRIRLISRDNPRKDLDSKDIAQLIESSMLCAVLSKKMGVPEGESEERLRRDLEVIKKISHPDKALDAIDKAITAFTATMESEKQQLDNWAAGLVPSARNIISSSLILSGECFDGEKPLAGERLWLFVDSENSYASQCVVGPDGSFILTASGKVDSAVIIYSPWANIELNSPSPYLAVVRPVAVIGPRPPIKIHPPRRDVSVNPIGAEEVARLVKDSLLANRLLQKEQRLDDTVQSVRLKQDLASIQSLIPVAQEGILKEAARTLILNFTSRDFPSESWPAKFIHTFE